MRAALLLLVFASVARADDMEDPVRRAHIFSIGFGWTDIGRVADQPPTRVFAVQLALGQQLTADLHLVEECDVATDRTGSDAFLVGVRWLPFAPHPQPPMFWENKLFPERQFDLTAVYLEPYFGVAFRSADTSDDHTLVGPATSLAIGHLGTQGRDFAIGVEVREQLAHYRTGFEHLFSVSFIVHVGS